MTGKRSISNPLRVAITEAFQGVKATSDTALKPRDMGLSKYRQATQLNRQNTSATR